MGWFTRKVKQVINLGFNLNDSEFRYNKKTNTIQVYSQGNISMVDVNTNIKYDRQGWFNLTDQGGMDSFFCLTPENEPNLKYYWGSNYTYETWIVFSNLHKQII